MSQGSPSESSSSTVEATEAKNAGKQIKLIYCETCCYSLNSEVQAAAHYSGKSHLKRLKRKAFTEQGTSPPTKKRLATMPSTTQLKTGFCPQLTNVGQTFNTSQTMTPAEFSFTSQQTARVSVGGVFQQLGGSFGQSHDQAQNSCNGLDVDPVAKAVMDNFLGVLPSKRHKAVRCSVCNLTFNSDSQGRAHFQGTRHKRKAGLATQETKAETPVQKMSKDLPATSKSVLLCETCRVSVNSEKQLEAHLQGQHHKNRVALAESGKAVHRRLWTEVPGNKSGWFFCSSCDISVPTAAALSQHIVSTEHTSKREPDWD